MFSPGAGTGRGRKRPNRTLLNKTETRTGSPSPVTPLSENRIIPDRPSTGTPAPWAPRLSVLARSPAVNRSEKVPGSDPTKPVFVGEFPDVVRDEQANLLQKRSSAGDAYLSGGMDRESSLSWIISGDKVFIWSYLSPAVSKNCIVLRIPSDSMEIGHSRENLSHGNSWLVCLVNWGGANQMKSKFGKHFTSVGIVICNRRTRAVFYWPDIYLEKESKPVCGVASSDEADVIASPADGKMTPSRHGSGVIGSNAFNSLIVSPISNEEKQCVALACSSGGELWQFQCCLKFITRKMICKNIYSSFSSDSSAGHFVGNRGYPRSLVWRHSYPSSKENAREFFLLTDHEIQCFSVGLSSGFAVSKLWSHEIIGSDGDQGIKKDLAGQKRIWPLDAQGDDRGKEITVLVATFCKDRVSGSSYTRYSLLTMQYKSERSVSSEGEESSCKHNRVLEKKCPLQVIIPKARVEEEDFLFSMKLRIGGKPSGSAVILSGDGTATVSHYSGNATKLYQFDLPYDAGKVLDASVLPSTEDNDEGAWVVLTEKAGIWAIPQKAVVLGGVEPPERSLSRKGSSNGGSTQEERRNLTFGSVAPRRASSEALESGNRQRAAMTGIARRAAQDEESEALLGHLFNDFLLSGQVDESFEKLKNADAFLREGEMNVFVRMSKSIVDTLAKHWTTTRGAEIVAMAVVSTQLVEKQQKHQKFLQFLALSKCHDKLSSSQRSALLSIMEHGEKLAGMIKLRELHNLISHADEEGIQHPSSEIKTSGALWDLIQLVGERARRNTVLLMDRDNAEVFYSKVSELEEIFYCIEKQLDYFISTEQPFGVQIHRAFELSNACVTVIQTAVYYKQEHHLWYPSLEGLTPWHCQSVVRNGLWSIASLLLQLSNDAAGVDVSTKLEIHTKLKVLTEVLLEAYTGAITAKVERGEEEKGLLEEFWSRRDILLDSLYMQTKDLVNTLQQDPNGGSGEQCQEIIRTLYSDLLAIAKQHEVYRTLWNICCDLNDAMLLRSLMKESMGPKGGFGYFVFKQLYENKQHSRLLRLGEEFPEKLSLFVEQYPNLLWLHEVFLHQFSSASDTLHALALSETQGYVSEAEEGTELEHRDLNLTLARRKHFLNLSKIATLAGDETAMETKVARLEADLKILKLQEEVTELLDNKTKQSIGNKLLRPEDLIELCLKSSNADITLRAFDVFAWTSSSFLRSHKSLLEECWKNAADQDDWGSLYEASTAEGWTDEETLHVLKDTLLFQASSRCYGPEAVTFEEGFEEVLPLRQDNSEPLVLKDSGSLETILMQHKNYPDAGKLMLTAVMLGSIQGSAGEECPSPME